MYRVVFMGYPILECESLNKCKGLVSEIPDDMRPYVRILKLNWESCEWEEVA